MVQTPKSAVVRGGNVGLWGHLITLEAFTIQQPLEAHPVAVLRRAKD